MPAWLQWRNIRRATQAFKQTIDDCVNDATVVVAPQIQDVGFRWYPLAQFINRYNAKIPATMGDRFKFQPSQPIQDLAAGIHAAYPGQWEAFVCVDRAALFSSVQVNYQIGLGALCRRIPAWTAAWSSMWATTTRAGPLDPAVGDIREVPLRDLYRSQVYAALWRKAKFQVDDWWAARIWTVQRPQPAQPELVKALFVYLTVCLAINVPDDEFGKNNFPQLVKTSPAAVVEALVTLGVAGGYFASIAKPTGENSESQFVKTQTQGPLRELRNLEQSPGFLPTTSPYRPPPGTTDLAYNSGYAPFSSNDGDLLSGPPQPAQLAFFKYTWTTIFDRANNPLTSDNKYGFIGGCPFHLPWARGVHSAFNAIPIAANGGQPADVKILIESRYDRSLLNIGFDPYVNDALFGRSYLSLVNIASGEADRNAVAALVLADYPDNGVPAQRVDGAYRH